MPRPVVAGVYELRCGPTAHRYIGASRNVGLRRNQHSTELRRGCHSSKGLQALYDAHGRKSLVLTVLEEVPRSLPQPDLIRRLLLAEWRWSMAVLAEGAGLLLSNPNNPYSSRTKTGHAPKSLLREFRAFCDGRGLPFWLHLETALRAYMDSLTLRPKK